MTKSLGWNMPVPRRRRLKRRLLKQLGHDQFVAQLQHERFQRNPTTSDPGRRRIVAMLRIADSESELADMEGQTH